MLPLSNELLKAYLAWNLSQTADCVGWILTRLGSIVLAELQQCYENHGSSWEEIKIKQQASKVHRNLAHDSISSQAFVTGYRW